jgi:hypothetical protein
LSIYESPTCICRHCCGWRPCIAMCYWVHDTTSHMPPVTYMHQRCPSNLLNQRPGLRHIRFPCHTTGSTLNNTTQDNSTHDSRP